jgi:hypothetical protein
VTQTHRPYVGFEDLTLPDERPFGFYLVTVADPHVGQVYQVSYATARRLARSRTQYGDAELTFLGAIDTPALD